jgi:hypothetical protein
MKINEPNIMQPHSIMAHVNQNSYGVLKVACGLPMSDPVEGFTITGGDALGACSAKRHVAFAKKNENGDEDHR